MTQSRYDAEYPARGLADPMRALDTELVHQTERVADQLLGMIGRVRLRRRGAAAAARIKTQHAIVTREARHPATPEIHVAAVAMMKEDGIGFRCAPWIGVIGDLIFDLDLAYPHCRKWNGHGVVFVSFMIASARAASSVLTGLIRARTRHDVIAVYYSRA